MDIKVFYNIQYFFLIKEKILVHLLVENIPLT